ncbi:MAG: glycosyltransferase family 2 protein [Lachnospiraceae bacterium]|nr:glycosyltransferase family 2 protein [Lachnospiraceae bacterium]MBR0428497.1 glycosyltransferase family 2 protein [Lachnospiraceae bacterium]
MVSISLCMIVKNEEMVLERCLESIHDLVDEIIIVDTGSTDDTKSIAAKYTRLIYDFSWVDDFSKARNFAFSKATGDYIYSCDADEVLDDVNRNRFLQLKEVLMPEVEIVQMKYVENGLQSVLNSNWEYRPKLYKRLRTFKWIDPIHETVRTEPVVFDSDIEILHMPESLHQKRDFHIFASAYKTDGRLSKKLYSMYAKELLKCGSTEDVRIGSEIFAEVLEKEELDADLFRQLCCIVARNARLQGSDADFLKYAMKVNAVAPCSEICCELGEYFFAKKDYEEASLWFYNAIDGTESILDVHSGGNLPMLRIADAYSHMADALDPEEAPTGRIEELQRLATEYRNKAKEWTMP